MRHAELDLRTEVVVLNGKIATLTADNAALRGYCENAEKAIQLCEALRDWGHSTPEHLASRVANVCNLYANAVHTLKAIVDQRDAAIADNAALREALEGIIRRVALVSPHYENARAALESNAGADLLKRHAEELAEARDVALAFASKDLDSSISLRQQLEAAGAQARKSHDAALGFQNRALAAEAREEALRQRAEAAEQYSAELNSRQVALLQERDAANSAWAKCEQEAAALTKERDEARARADALEAGRTMPNASGPGAVAQSEQLK